MQEYVDPTYKSFILALNNILEELSRTEKSNFVSFIIINKSLFFVF